MKLIATTAAALVAFAGTAYAGGHAASGDAAAGEDVFKQCQSCHVVQSEDGEILAGNRAKTGPNLYGIAGRTAGIVEDFRYGDSIVEAGEGGAVFDEANFVAYVQDPRGWLREVTGDNRARSKMSYRLRSEEDAINLYAYLAQFGAEEEEAATN